MSQRCPTSQLINHTHVVSFAWKDQPSVVDTTKDLTRQQKLSTAKDGSRLEMLWFFTQMAQLRSLIDLRISLSCLRESTSLLRRLRICLLFLHILLSLSSMETLSEAALSVLWYPTQIRWQNTQKTKQSKKALCSPTRLSKSSWLTKWLKLAKNKSFLASKNQKTFWSTTVHSQLTTTCWPQLSN